MFIDNNTDLKRKIAELEVDISDIKEFFGRTYRRKIEDRDANCITKVYDTLDRYGYIEGNIFDVIRTLEEDLEGMKDNLEERLCQ